MRLEHYSEDLSFALGHTGRKLEIFKLTFTFLGTYTLQIKISCGLSISIILLYSGINKDRRDIDKLHQSGKITNYMIFIECVTKFPNCFHLMEFSNLHS